MGGLRVYGKSWDLEGIHDIPDPFAPYTVRDDDNHFDRLNHLHHTGGNAQDHIATVGDEPQAVVKAPSKTLKVVDSNK